MLTGAGVVMTLVLVLLALTFGRSGPLGRIGARGWLVGGGLVLPGVTLTALGAYALVLGESLLARPVPGEVTTVRAVGRQWEWRFGAADGELRPGRLIIPAGRPVDVLVTSEDVIHSFWVPRLAGKIDAIPGHVNVIRISAAEPGIYAGVCAEYCGVGHTHMPFVVEAVAEPAPPAGAASEAGR